MTSVDKSLDKCRQKPKYFKYNGQDNPIEFFEAGIIAAFVSHQRNADGNQKSFLENNTRR